MRKYWKIILPVMIVMFLAVGLFAFRLWPDFPQSSSINSDSENVSRNATLDEEFSTEKVFCNATLDDEFATDMVLIVLTNEASLEFVDHDYTPADFPKIGCIEVQDLSSATTEHIRKQLRGEEIESSGRPGSYWFTQPKDLTKYRRILSLKLDQESKSNVLFAIKVLEYRNDIYSAEPNYILHMVD